MTAIPTEQQTLDTIEHLTRNVVAVWNEYRDLFADHADAEVCNAAAPGFFRLVQVTFMETIALGVCRLLDPPGNRHQLNASLAQLIAQARATRGSDERLDRFDARLRELLARTERIRLLRDKGIAHADLAVLYGRNLPVEDLGVLRDAVEEIARFVEDYGAMRGVSLSISTYGFRRDKGACQLLKVLRASQSRLEE